MDEFVALPHQTNAFANQQLNILSEAGHQRYNRYAIFNLNQNKGPNKTQNEKVEKCKGNPDQCGHRCVQIQREFDAKQIAKTQNM